MKFRKTIGVTLVAIPFAVILGSTIAAKGAAGALFSWDGAIIVTAMLLVIAMLLCGIRLLTGQPIR